MARRWDRESHSWVEVDGLDWTPIADIARLQFEHTKRMEAVNTLTREVRTEDRLDGPNVVINERGGKQSHVPERYDLVDPDAMRVVAGILGTGAEKYGTENWRLIPLRDHVNHAVAHLYAALRAERTGEVTFEDDLGNALCRVMFAVAMREEVQRGA